MALNDVSDIINEVLVRTNRSTTDSFITDQMLEDWLRTAHQYCSTQYKWPLSEVRDETISWDGSEEIDYSSFSINFKADSIRMLQIGDKRLGKRNFEDYLIFREERKSAQDRIFSDFGRILFINPNADVSGTITAWGQTATSIDPTDASATTVFSSFDEEGNEAMVEKMSSYLKRRENTVDEAELHDQRADAVLAKVWKKIQNEQYKYQTGRDSEGIWKRFDVIGGGFRDEIFNRDQFN